MINLSTQCTLQYDTTVMLERNAQIKCPGPPKETGNVKGWTVKSCMLTGRLNPLWQASGPLGWVRPKQAGSQRELGSGRPVAPFMTMRMAQWPHQEAEGTRRTRSSAVHVRLCGRRCTEHWLLFARTPKRRRREGYWWRLSGHPCHSNSKCCIVDAGTHPAALCIIYKMQHFRRERVNTDESKDGKPNVWSAYVFNTR